MALGAKGLLVAAKLAVGATDRADVVARAIADAERAARDAVPDLTLVMYLEPDVDRSAAHVPPRRRGDDLAGLEGSVRSGEHADGG